MDCWRVVSLGQALWEVTSQQVFSGMGTLSKGTVGGQGVRPSLNLAVPTEPAWWLRVGEKEGGRRSEVWAESPVETTGADW